MRIYLHFAAVLAFAGLAHAQTAGARIEFEVASVRPNTSGNNMVNIRPPVGGRFTATNARLKMLIGLAYKVSNFEISGGPAWINTDGYDVVARASDATIGIEQLRPMLQSLLADRFELAVHRETKEIPVYALLPTKNGPKLPEAKDGGCTVFGPNTPPPPPAPGQFPPTPCGGFFMSPNHLEGGKVSMTQLVNALNNLLDRRVIDHTGFTGAFDVKLDFAPEGMALGGVAPHAAPGDPGNSLPAGETSAPSIFTVLQEQLGLKLESQKGSAEMLVIDHAAKATEN